MIISFKALTSSIFSLMLICRLSELILLILKAFLSFSRLSLDFLSGSSSPAPFSPVSTVGTV